MLKLLIPNHEQILFYLFSSVFNLYFLGLRKVKDSYQKKKMRLFLFGLLFSLTSIFATIGSQIVSDTTIGVILDVTFLLTLSISSFIMMISFLLKQSTKSPNSSKKVVQEYIDDLDQNFSDWDNKEKI